MSTELLASLRAEHTCRSYKYGDWDPTSLPAGPDVATDPAGHPRGTGRAKEDI